jgi:hypothetical protein
MESERNARGIDEIVVDPTVDDVDPARAARGTHEDLTVVDEQVRPLHELDAHGFGQERVLEEGRVVHPGRHHHDVGVVTRARRHGSQDVEQILRIALDGPDLVRTEQRRPDALQDAPILDDVRDA